MVYPVRAGSENRTHDLWFTIPLLYQLSYPSSNGVYDTIALQTELRWLYNSSTLNYKIRSIFWIASLRSQRRQLRCRRRRKSETFSSSSRAIAKRSTVFRNSKLSTLFTIDNTSNTIAIPPIPYFASLNNGNSL